MAEKTSFKDLLEKFIPAILILTVILAFVVGILWQKVSSLEGGKTKTSKTEDSVQATPDANGKLPASQAEKVVPVSDEDHIYGNKDAEVKLVVYTDFECPFCKTFHITAEEAVDAYEGKLALVYRHFPLFTLHSQAETEALATECVAELGGDEAFWKYVDKIFEATKSNDGLDLTVLPTFAVNLGIDRNEFQNCLDSEKYKDKIAQQASGGEDAGVSGTPMSFVINQKGDIWGLSGAASLNSIQNIVDLALE